MYPVLLSASGLSIREAAAFHGVRPSSVENWSSGRRDAPKGALNELHNLTRRQMRAAQETLAVIREHPGAETLELGYPTDDHEAQGLGWPCVSAWDAMAGMLLSMMTGDEINRVLFAPRGSTIATAAAADRS